MRDLKNKQGKTLEMDGEKVEGINSDLFSWDEDGRQTGVEEPDRNNTKVDIPKER